MSVTRGAKRSILFVTDVTPLPLDRGQRVRVANVLAACRREFKVTFLGPKPPTPRLQAEFADSCDGLVWIDSVPPRQLGHPKSLLAALRAAPGLRLPRTVRMYVPFAAALHTVDPGEFDLVWAERPHIARLLAAVRKRTILDLDDVEHVRIRRHLALHRSWWPSGELLREVNRYFLYRRMELRWSRGFRATVVCSESDRLYLEGHGCRNVRVVPNGVNESGTSGNEQRGGTTAGGRPLRVAFLGNLAHGPNLDAVTYFADEVLPLLKTTEPDFVFEVFGPVGDDARVRPYRDRVRFHGFVPDIAAALSECDVFVAPIRYGSGTRVKLLDAMACGIPVVTTAVGAEGLDVVDGEHVLVAAGARGLADAIAAIWRDPSLGPRLAGRARELVDRRYRNAAIQDDVARWLAALAEVDG